MLIVTESRNTAIIFRWNFYTDRSWIFPKGNQRIARMQCVGEEMGVVVPFSGHTLASRNGKRSGRRPQIRSQNISRYTGLSLDLRNPLRGDLVFFPTKSSRLMDAKTGAKFLKAQVMRSTVGPEGVLHGRKVAYDATNVNSAVASRDNDFGGGLGLPLQMPQRKIATIHQDKTPQRIHFVVEWAELRGKEQKDFAKDGVADKSTVSRWYGGQLPTEDNLNKIAAYLSLDDVTSLFRHPDDDWIRKLLQNRDAREREQIKQTIQIAFPEKSSKRG